MVKLYHLITGLSIDYVENKLYWISSGNGTINRCNLDGSNLEVIETMKEELTKTVPEEAQTSDFLNRNFKSNMLNITKERKEIMYQYLKQITRKLSHQVNKISKKI